MTTTPPGAFRSGSSRSNKLRILLIAYEFPPSPSPQSLRWAYLTGRLAAFGHEVHVLAPDVSGTIHGLPAVSPCVRVHRAFPGPVRGLLGWLALRRPVSRSTDDSSSTPPSMSASADWHWEHLGPSCAAEPPRLNWKGRILESFQSIVSWCLFPDLRAEWKRPARESLHQLLNELKPDVVVSSHEPATTLQLGLEAKRRGFRWVADLGDPVLAAYTPARWRRTAAILESTVMREADHVLVTAEQARELLERRHGGSTPVTVVTQGFEEGFVPARPCARALDGPLELLYGGSFYSFRDPRALVEAVLAVPGVRLHVASGSVPAWLAKIARNNSAQVRLLGRVPHQRLLALQRQVDVLINIANLESSQVPGKFYEYLGAGRPVLHLLAGQEMDATGALVHRLRRGRTCAASRGAIAAELAYLLEARARGALDQGFDLGPEAVRAWSWTASAECAESALNRAAAS